MNSAILVAAGKSTRMGPAWTNCFSKWPAARSIAHTWQRFEDAKCIGEIILVVREGRQKEFEELAEKFHFQKPFRIVAGGAERQDSVWNGLEALSPTAEIVAIHDAARPCVSEELIAATIKRGGRNRRGGRGATGDGHHQGIRRRPVDCSGRWTVPGCGRCRRRRRFASRSSAARLRRRAQRQLIFTDDTAACELIGQPVRLVSRVRPNPKVTVPGDLPLVEALLRNF